MDDKRKIEIADITAMMAQQGVRDFINDILDVTGVYSDTYSTDPQDHAYNAGKKKIGYYIIDKIKNAAPEKYIKLLEDRDDDR